MARYIQLEYYESLSFGFKTYRKLILTKRLKLKTDWVDAKTLNIRPSMKYDSSTFDNLCLFKVVHDIRLTHGELSYKLH